MVSTTTLGQGSSPLTRGKQRQHLSLITPLGFIPAHAGKTEPHPDQHRVARVHPRSRGENEKPRRLPRMRMGSSQLTRGKRQGLGVRGANRWFIPAHAGKTAFRRVNDLQQRVHPRSRGENLLRNGNRLVELGASPLTRGKHQADRTRRRKDGLIPAHAGKTQWSPLRMGVAWAHPRSRGENTMRPARQASHRGSSPLTQGKLGTEHGRYRGRGLIPAHAGKTCSSRKCPRPIRAHPRSRGENPHLVTMDEIWKGSSPLTRGKRRVASSLLALAGLIPAHAGKTS